MATLLVNQMPPSACPVQQQVLPQGWRAEYEQSSGQWYVTCYDTRPFFALV